MRYDHILLAVLLAVSAAAPARAEPVDTPAPAAAASSSSPEADAAPTAPAEATTTPAANSEPAAIEPAAPVTAEEVAGGAEEVPEEVKKATPPPPPPRPTLAIDINLTTQTMNVAEDGVSKYTWRVSSGAYGYPTPTGSFSPIWMTKMWYSRKYDNAPMPHSIFFSGGNAIHATYSIGMLGTPASHGCVRLSPSHAAALYKLVSQHTRAATRIVVHGKPTYTAPKIAKRRSGDPRFAYYGTRPTTRYSYNYGGGYNGYGYGTKYVYPGDAPAYYYPPKRRTQYGYRNGKPRRYVMRQYYSPYGY